MRPKLKLALTITADVTSPRGDGGDRRRQRGVGRSRCDVRVATTRRTRPRRDICGRKMPGKGRWCPPNLSDWCWHTRVRFADEELATHRTRKETKLNDDTLQRGKGVLERAKKKRQSGGGGAAKLH
ncbi:MAG: hypothetical protein CMB32_03625 [Euryarchaeota archaeon]|nr:hypothetical protein [Euryarchaeota archaeon]